MCKDTTRRGKRPPEQAGIKQTHLKRRIKLQAKWAVEGGCLPGAISKAVLEAPLQTKGWQNPGALCPGGASCTPARDPGREGQERGREGDTESLGQGLIGSCAAQCAQQRRRVCENSWCKKHCEMHWIYRSLTTGTSEEALYANIGIYKQL